MHKPLSQKGPLGLDSPNSVEALSMDNIRIKAIAASTAITKIVTSPAREANWEWFW